jgi:hypothetical protein
LQLPLLLGRFLTLVAACSVRTFMSLLGGFDLVRSANGARARLHEAFAEYARIATNLKQSYRVSARPARLHCPLSCQWIPLFAQLSSTRLAMQELQLGVESKLRASQEKRVQLYAETHRAGSAAAIAAASQRAIATLQAATAAVTATSAEGKSAGPAAAASAGAATTAAQQGRVLSVAEYRAQLSQSTAVIVEKQVCACCAAFCAAVAVRHWVSLLPAMCRDVPPEKNCSRCCELLDSVFASSA